MQNGKKWIILKNFKFNILFNYVTSSSSPISTNLKHILDDFPTNLDLSNQSGKYKNTSLQSLLFTDYRYTDKLFQQ